ncbi:YbaB/EbfC family nucleoid-associated protein [Nocardia crassostreae]|uniref:YbaB/EbfC family nucleoid-associated protein n=1 Tax=Nocardia crassostreae TaxID=53428 RepID=UPI00082C3D13|nr:YbaB/EbfC family nucleoid-associated protein [Nocardia crassostreae]
MVNERMRADAETMLDGLARQLEGIAQLQARRAELTATATACARRIRVTVNADGLLIRTEFADDIADLSYAEIAAAMTGAVQAAASEVNAKWRELMAPLQQERLRLPKLSDIVEGAPDLGSLLPPPPAPPTRVDRPPPPVERESAAPNSAVAEAGW